MLSVGYEPELPGQLDLPENWDSPNNEKTAVQKFLYPDEADLPNDFEVRLVLPAWLTVCFTVMIVSTINGLDVLLARSLSPSHKQVMLLLQMPIWDHLEELRERVLLGALAAGVAVLTCFAFSKELVVFLEAPVASQGVRFLQLSPGEFFFTTLKVNTALLVPL